MAHKEERSGSQEKFSKHKNELDLSSKKVNTNKWGSNPYDETPIPTLAKYTINLADQTDARVQTFDETQEFPKPSNHAAANEYAWEVKPQSNSSGQNAKFDQDLERITHLANNDLDLLRESLMILHPRSLPDKTTGQANPQSKLSTEEARVREITRILQENKDKPDFVGQIWETINKLTSDKAKQEKKEEPKIESVPSKPNFRIGSAGGSLISKSRPGSGIVQTNGLVVLPPKAGKPFQDESERFFGEGSVSESRKHTTQTSSDELNLDFVLGESPNETSSKEGRPNPSKPQTDMHKPKGAGQGSKLPELSAVQKQSKPQPDITDSLFASGIEVLEGAKDVVEKESLPRPQPVKDGLQPSPVEDDQLALDSQNTVVLRIKSSVGGDGGVIGVAQLRLFDQQGREIPLKDTHLHLQGVPQATLGKLVRGTPYSLDGKDSFKMDFPLLASFVDLRIKYMGPDPGYLRLWNYNGAQKTIGVSELELLVNERIIGLHKLAPGPGSASIAYGQDLPLAKGVVTLPPAEIAPKGQVVQPTLNPAAYASEGLGTLEESFGGGVSRRKLLEERGAVNPPVKKMGGHEDIKDFGESAGRKEVGLPSAVHAGNNATGEIVTRRGSGLLGRVKVHEDEIDGGREGEVVTNTKVSETKVQSLQERRDQAKLRLQEQQKDGSRPELKHTMEKVSFPSEARMKAEDQQPTVGISRRPQQPGQKPKPTKPKESLVPETFGLESQLINLEDSLLLPIEKKQPVAVPLKGGKTGGDLAPTQSPGDALDSLAIGGDFITPLRHFDRKNFSKIELSEVNWGDIAPVNEKKVLGTVLRDNSGAGTVVPRRQAQGKIAADSKSSQSDSLPKDQHMSEGMSSKPAKDDYDLGERYSYATFQELVADHEYFCVPELPRGQVLEFDFYTNWGDKFYIGLCGIELFDEHGKMIQINPALVSADPSSLNVLPDIKGDPRTVDKLVDGEFLTTDEKHFWLTPYYPTKPARVRIDTGRRVTLSMIRIWNYNRDRVHTARGVREFSVKIDGILMFFGEIRRASGNAKRVLDNAEWIALCGESLFDAIEQNDWLTREPDENLMESKMVGPEEIRQSIRPGTSSKNGSPDGPIDIDAIKKQLEHDKQRIKELADERELKKVTAAQPDTKLTENLPYIECTKLSIQILENWGDSAYVGLTGLEFFDPEDRQIRVTSDMLNARPRDIATEHGNQDLRILENLVNGMNVTCEAKHMWLTPFTPRSVTPSASLSINFEERRKIAYLKIWNYNKSPEDTFRGAKKVEINADLTKITSSFLFLKKAPGTDEFDFCQIVKFPPPKSRQVSRVLPPDNNWLPQYSLPPRFPTGFTIQFWFLSTWGDPYYIGLNAIEVFDKKGKALISSRSVPFVVFADPADVSILPGHSNDSRTASNLVNPESQTAGSNKCWLCPYINLHTSGSPLNLGRQKNTFTLMFESPISISGIKIWNYSQNTARGVREFMCLLDDQIIFTVVFG